MLKTTVVTISIILGLCFILFLVWVSIMVLLLKKMPNQKIEAMGNFFNKLPIKRFFNSFPINNSNKKSNTS